MSRFLIVNADDFNLTRGVDRAILYCHDRGIVSSTTFMINLPVASSTVRDVKKRKELGVGLHLNVTFNKPLLKTSKVKSLTGGHENFRKMKEQLGVLPSASELFSEYSAQIEKFVKVFGRKPTHLDTHHQMHNHPFFLKVLSEIAKRFKVPMRTSCLLRQSSIFEKLKPPVVTDYFFGNLTPEGHWTHEPLEVILKNLPSGVSEVMCHPGIVDGDLKSVSSFTTGRAVELAVFSSGIFRKILSDYGIRLVHFGVV